MQDFVTYFAYGSNMSPQRLHERVPTAIAIGPGSLKGHRLAFHKRGRDDSGKCDAYATGSANDQLYGVLYRIPTHGKAELDRIEGLGAGYDEKAVNVRRPQRVWFSALTYVATDIQAGLTPYWWYKHHVLAGARAFDLPSPHIIDIQAVAASPDPDPVRRHREMAPYLRSLR